MRTPGRDADLGAKVTSDYFGAVPADQRGGLRPLTREYRRWQRTRALLVKQFARLLAFIDQLAELRLERWPPPKPEDHGPGTG